MLGNSFGDRYSLRISLILVLVGLSGLYIEIINAFEYVQGARIGFENLMSHYLWLSSNPTVVLFWVDIKTGEKTDADCFGSENKCSTNDFISHKNDLDLFELSIMVH